MKMKPDPLRGKIIRKFTYIDKGFDYRSVKSAVEFYKKYQHESGMVKFRRERPYDWKIFDEEIMSVQRQWCGGERLISYSLIYNLYRSWLFDYTFSDVIE